MRSSPRAVSTSATIGMSGSRLAVSVTWSTDSTIASITPPAVVLASMARSSSQNWVPKPFTRTQSLLPSASQRTTFSRAAALPFGATASSMSRTTMSARERAAGANLSYWAPLTKSQLRASTGSMRVPASWVSLSHPAGWSYIAFALVPSAALKSCRSIVPLRRLATNTSVPQSQDRSRRAQSSAARSPRSPASNAGAFCRCQRKPRWKWHADSRRGSHRATADR